MWEKKKILNIGGLIKSILFINKFTKKIFMFGDPNIYHGI